jgi:hypothetical protein
MDHNIKRPLYSKFLSRLLRSAWQRSVPVFASFLGLSIWILRLPYSHFNQSIGLIYDWAFKLLPANLNFDQVTHIWSVANNGGVSLFNTGFVFTLLEVGLAKLTGHPSQSMLILVTLLMASSGYTMYELLIYLKTRRLAAWLAGCFYLSSFIFISRLSAGYTWYLVSMAFFPAVIQGYFILSREQLTLRTSFIMVLISLFAFAQVQFIPFFLLIILVDGSAALVLKESLSKRLVAAAIVFGGWGLLNAFWLIPILTGINNGIPTSGINARVFLSRIDSLPHSFWNTLLLSDFSNTQPIIMDMNLSPSRLGVLLACISGVLWGGYLKVSGRYFYMLFFSLVAIAFPLMLGATEPFGRLYPKLLHLLPALSMYRETHHLQYLILLFYTVALGFTADYLLERFRSRDSRVVLCTGLLAGVVLFNLASLSGDLFGYFGTTNQPDGLAVADQRLQQLTPGRLFYGPNLNFWKLQSDSRNGVNYPDQLANSMANNAVTGASSDLEGRNLAWRLRDATSFAFIHGQPQFETLLSYLGSSTLVERQRDASWYPRSVELTSRPADVSAAWNGNYFSPKRLAQFPGLTATALNSNMNAYQFPDMRGTAYLADRLNAVCNYSEAGSGKAAFITEASSPLESYASSNCQQPKSFIAGIGILGELKHRAALGWSPGYLAFYENAAFADSVADFFYTQIPDNLAFSLPENSKAGALVRYYVSPRGGELTINDVKVSTKSDQAGWQYMEIATNGSSVHLHALSGENAVTYGVYDGTAPAKAALPLGGGDLMARRLSPTEVAVTLSGTSTSSRLIVFSENYHPQWRLRIAGKEYKPVLVNGYANGFIVPGDVRGSGTIVFAFQAVYWSVWLIDSVLILSLIAYLIVTSLLRHDKASELSA